MMNHILKRGLQLIVLLVMIVFNAGWTLAQEAIEIDKRINGMSIHSPPGPSIPVGSTINWTYIVTNTGVPTLYNVLVTDDKATVSCPKIGLAPAESMTCTASGVATAGPYTNTATVTTTDEGGQPSATASSVSYYVGGGAAVPSLTAWGMIVFTVMLLFSALVFLRKNKRPV